MATYGKPKGVAAGGGAHRCHWTREQWYRAGDAGIFHPEDRTELIAGEVYVDVGMTPRRASALTRTAHRFYEAVENLPLLAQSRLPITLAADGEVSPGVAVIRGNTREYSESHPTQDDTLLVVEVSDSTLGFDRGRKASYYAEAGIADYWIVNIPGSRVEVYRNPHSAPENPWGFAYDAPQIYRPGDTVVALAVPLTVPVAVLLPVVAETEHG